MNDARSNLPRSLVLGLVISLMPSTLLARDPGLNQPGAVGNVGVDPGLNQPGAAGNVGAPVRRYDPGFNRPGAMGNRGFRR